MVDIHVHLRPCARAESPAAGAARATRRARWWIQTALLPLVVIVGVLPACGGQDTLPPAVSAPDQGRAPSSESTASAPSVGTEPPDTEPLDARPTTSAPVSTVPPQAEEVVVSAGCAPISIPTGDTEIIGERCDPGPSFTGPRPAAVVLNGCGGYTADNEIGSAIATALAGEGISAVRIDYLGAVPALDFCVPAGLTAAAGPILGAVADTVAFMRLDPTIAADRIGAVGYSLGAVTAMSASLGGAGLAEIEPVALSAVSLLSYPNWLPEVTDQLAAGRGPALFVMTGAIDDVAPPAGAEAVVAAALDGGLRAELLLVSEQGHLWTGPVAALAASLIARELADRLAV